jgi:hypothetical protein
MESIRSAEAVKPVSHIYFGENVQARVRALGEYGKRAGMAEEIDAFLASCAGRAAVLARYLLAL